MTILKLYNRNGSNCMDQISNYRYSDFLHDYSDRDKNQTGHFSAKPKTNFLEEKESYILILAIPGVLRSDLRIELNKGQVLVSYTGGKSVSGEMYVRKEFDMHHFERSFWIPEAVDLNKISANYENGILRITLPKKNESIDKGPRNIKIS